VPFSADDEMLTGRPVIAPKSSVLTSAHGIVAATVVPATALGAVAAPVLVRASDAASSATTAATAASKASRTADVFVNRMIAPSPALAGPTDRPEVVSGDLILVKWP
jgi:hypothetical protein